MFLDRLLKVAGEEVRRGGVREGPFFCRLLPAFGSRREMFMTAFTTASLDDTDPYCMHRHIRFASEPERIFFGRLQVERAIERKGLSIRLLAGEELDAMLSGEYGLSEHGGQI